MDSIELKSVWQVRYVVRDLDEALSRFSRVLDVGPWKIWTYGPHTVSVWRYAVKSSPSLSGSRSQASCTLRSN